jgi:hypothetical protein
MIERAAVALALALAVAAPMLAAAGSVATAILTARAPALIIGSLVALALAFLVVIQARRRLPATLDGALRRHPVRAALWTLLALFALAQVVRLSAFMADPARTWGSAVSEPSAIRHMCMTAYVHAAELNRRGEPNIYDELHWPVFHEGAEETGAPSTVAELGPLIQDPYEYPPPLLLLGRAALALTNHFLVIRGVWFAVQWIAFVAIALMLASFIGDTEGRLVGLLLPAVVGWISTMFDFQWGQAHLITIALAMGAWVAFDRKRPVLGGALLGTATVVKLFPALLIVYLLLRRRYAEALWSVAMAVLLMLLSLAVLGTAPFVAFVTYQLPRIADGRAFDFYLRQPFYIARNYSVAALPYKLRLLGVPGMGAALSHALGWIYALTLLGLVVWTARQKERDRLGEAMVWLGLLNLGALRSPLAPSAYVASGAIWLITFLIAARPTWRTILFCIVAGVLLTGTPPLPKPRVDVAVNLIGWVAMFAVCLYAILQARRPQAALPAPAR